MSLPWSSFAARPLSPALRRGWALLLALALFGAACSGSETAAVGTEADASATSEPTTAPEPTDPPEPTAAPEPTDVPEPTAAPEPTDAPEPTAAPEATTASAPAVSDPSRDFTPVTDEIEAFVADRELNGAGIIVVHRDEGVLYHDHFGEFTEDRISLIASSSKMISAGVLLRLQDDGVLDINTPVREYVDWADPASDITVAQMLSNSSGLVGLGPNLLYGPYICQWLPTEELQSCGETVLAGTDDDADVIPPDTEFRYGGAQWQVAGAVAQSVTGTSWDDLVADIYAEPCGLDSLGYISLGSVLTEGGLGYPTAFAGDPDAIAPTNNPNIEGGGYITTGDYGQLLLMHLRDGMCGETQVLSTAALDTMHTDRIEAAYDGSAGRETGYGMGWWVDRTTGRISDGGAFGTVPWLDLDDGYGAYLVVEDTSGTGQALAAQIEDLVHTAVVG